MKAARAKGVSRNWLFEGNYCDSYADAQSVALEDIQNVTIRGNEMVGKATKAFALGKGSTGIIVQDNDGSDYGREVGFDDPSARSGLPRTARQLGNPDGGDLASCSSYGRTGRRWP